VDETRRGAMHLLISELMTVDAVLDRAITWVDTVHEGTTLDLHDIAMENGDDAPSQRPTLARYDPRLSALRQALAGC
jgi:hypothetical protein